MGAAGDAGVKVARKALESAGNSKLITPKFQLEAARSHSSCRLHFIKPCQSGGEIGGGHRQHLPPEFSSLIAFRM